MEQLFPKGNGLFRIGVLISGSGSNLQSIIDRLHNNKEEIEVALVISSDPDAYGLRRAEKAGIPTEVFPLEDFATREEHDLAMVEKLERHGVDIIVLAGYMLIVTTALLDRFPFRVINLHPSLLPAFPGATGIEDAFAYGTGITGVTVHFVDEGCDTGPIILQEAVEIQYNDTVDTLRERIHAVEHRLLPRAIVLAASGKISFDQKNLRRVIIKD
jgi:phosphoribosylglycinamide formyltransferase-1